MSRFWIESDFPDCSFNLKETFRTDCTTCQIHKVGEIWSDGSASGEFDVTIKKNVSRETIEEK